MKSGNLNFLESSGPLQACNETVYLFTFSLINSLKFCQFHVHIVQIVPVHGITIDI